MARFISFFFLPQKYIFLVYQSSIFNYVSPPENFNHKYLNCAVINKRGVLVGMYHNVPVQVFGADCVRFPVPVSQQLR